MEMQRQWLITGQTITGLYYANRQWGAQASGNNWDVYYPIVFNNNVYGVFVSDYNAGNNELQYAGIHGDGRLNGFKMYTNTANDMTICYLAIGR